MKKYKLFSILIVILVIFFVLISLLMGCNKTNAKINSLSTGTITTTSINVNYSFSGFGYAHIKLCIGDSCDIVGTGDGSGSKTFEGLSPNTNYLFSLKQEVGGGSWATFASRTIKTLAE